MGLCDIFGLKFGLCVIARFRKLCGTKDNGLLCGRGVNCGAVGVTSMLLCSSSYVFCLVAIFVLYSFICASRRFLFIDEEKIHKKSCKQYACYTCLSIYLCVHSAIAHVL